MQPQVEISFFSLQPSSASSSAQKHVCFGSCSLLKSVWPKSKGPISPDELNKLCARTVGSEHTLGQGFYARILLQVTFCYRVWTTTP